MDEQRVEKIRSLMKDANITQAIINLIDSINEERGSWKKRMEDANDHALEALRARNEAERERDRLKRENKQLHAKLQEPQSHRIKKLKEELVKSNNGISRLRAENGRNNKQWLADCIERDNLQVKVYELQTWLGSISEPLRKWSEENKNRVEHLLGIDKVKDNICHQVAAYLSCQQVALYPDFPKPECEHRNWTYRSLIGAIEEPYCEDCQSFFVQRKELR